MPYTVYSLGQLPPSSLALEARTWLFSVQNSPVVVSFLAVVHPMTMVLLPEARSPKLATWPTSTLEGERLERASASKLQFSRGQSPAN